jgi:hypothetical protein
MPDDKGENTIKELIAAFSTLQNPVGVSEYREFWNSLTDEQKAYYKTAKI